MSGTPDLDMMRERLSQLAVEAIINDDPRAHLRARRYAVGFHLARARWDKTAKENVRNAIRSLNDFKAKHPDIFGPRTRQTRLALN